MSGRVAVLTLTKRNCRFTAWSKPSHHLSSERAPPKRATDFEPPEAAPKPFFALSLSSLRIIFFFSLSKRVRSVGLDCFLEGGIAAHGSNLDS